MGNKGSNNNQLGDHMMTDSKNFKEKYESKLKTISSSDINQNLRDSITKDLFTLTEIINGKLGIVKIGIIGRSEISSDNFIESLLLTGKSNIHNLPYIYCSENVINCKNYSDFKFNQNFFGQSFDLDPHINLSLNQIFKNTSVSNNNLRISQYPDLPIIIKDHLMLIDLPKFQRIERFKNQGSNSKTDNIEIDLNDIQNMLLYFSHCDIIIYLVNEKDRDLEIDYLTKLIENSLILQNLKQENKLYFLIDDSSNKSISNINNLQVKLGRIISNINHKFYYEVNLKNGIHDKTLFFYRYFKLEKDKIYLNELNRLKKEFNEIAEKRYTKQGKKINGKNDAEFRKFKRNLKEKYEDPKNISKDYREFEEVLIGEVLNQISKNLNLIKSELAYKILIALSKQFGNYTLFLDRSRFLREEIINNIETIFSEIIRIYEDKKEKLIEENSKLQETIKDIGLVTFNERSLLVELFDFTGNNHKYSYLINNTRNKFNGYILTLFNKFSEISNEMMIKLSYLERSILNSYNRVLLSFENEFVLNSKQDVNIFLQQIGNTPIEKVLSYKLRSTIFFTNVFMSNFHQKKPKIRSIFPYYLLPNIIGLVVGIVCFSQAYLSKNIKKSFLPLTQGYLSKNIKKSFLPLKLCIGGIIAMVTGFYLSTLLNKCFKNESKEAFKENIVLIEENVNNLTSNFVKFGEKLGNFENYYKSKATEFVDLF